MTLQTRDWPRQTDSGEVVQVECARRKTRYEFWTHLTIELQYLFKKLKNGPSYRIRWYLGQHTRKPTLIKPSQAYRETYLCYRIRTPSPSGYLLTIRIQYITYAMNYIGIMPYYDSINKYHLRNTYDRTHEG